MYRTSTDNNDFDPSGCAFWFMWVLTSTICYLVGLRVNSIFSSVSGHSTLLQSFVLGTVVGVGQWLILRRSMPQAIWWISATGLGAAITAIPHSDLIDLSETGISTRLLVLALGYIWIGIAQWLVLELHVLDAGHWIWLSPLGWFVLQVIIPLWPKSRVPISVGVWGIVGSYLYFLQIPSERLRRLCNKIRRPMHRFSNIHRRAKMCRAALELVDRRKEPIVWALLNADLGFCLTNTASPDRPDAIEQAIFHSKQALEVFTRHKDRKAWAALHTNLASAYMGRIRGDLSKNIELAIHHSEQTLEVYTRRLYPEEWAETQHGLALAYAARIKDEHAVNMEQAIKCGEDALTVFTQQKYPRMWALVKNHLAIAYSERVHGDRADNIEKAICYAQDSLQATNRWLDREQWAQSYVNLAAAYSQRVDGKPEVNLERVVHYSKHALRVFSRRKQPFHWAMIQNNLAYAYTKCSGSEWEQNNKKAIKHAQQAPKVFKRDTYPTGWAQSHFHLANAYAERVRNGQTKYMGQAVYHFSQALEVRTSDVFPGACLPAARNLGDLHFERENWEFAYVAYEDAIKAGDELYRAADTEFGKQIEIADTARLYVNAAYCLVRLKKYEDALQILEKGKTRLLREALVLGDLEICKLLEARQVSLRKKRDRIKNLEAKMRALDQPHSEKRYAEFLQYAQQIRVERSKLQELIKSIRIDHPNFMPTGLDPGPILSLIPENGVLIAPLVTSVGSAAFVIPHGAKTVKAENIVPLDDFNLESLKCAIEQLGDAITDWKDMGDAYFEKSSKRVGKLGLRLWNSLIAPITRCIESGVKHIILFPQGGMQLLPLHAACFEVNGRKHYLIDDYDVTYAPSAYVLSISQRRAAERGGRASLVVGVDNGLKNAVVEAEEVAAMLKTDALLTNRDATRDRLINKSPGSRYLHLACHGKFAENGNPLDSVLHLASAEPFSLKDVIEELNLEGTRLVTLSACETGVINVEQSPDEYVGFPAGFLQAGAAAVVGSLWAVDDLSTLFLMRCFYKNILQNNMSPAQALREAQRWLRDDVTCKEVGEYYQSYLRMGVDEAVLAFKKIASGSPDDKPYADPVHWAAFTFVGA